MSIWYKTIIFVVGRVHSAIISGINNECNSVTVEWYEKGEAKGKEVIETLIGQSSWFNLIVFFYFRSNLRLYTS